MPKVETAKAATALVGRAAKTITVAPKAAVRAAVGKGGQTATEMPKVETAKAATALVGRAAKTPTRKAAAGKAVEATPKQVASGAIRASLVVRRTTEGRIRILL